MKVIFMGSSSFATPILDSLIKSQYHKVVSVFAAPPKPQNRGLRVEKTPVHVLAEAYSLEVHTPNSVKKPDVIRLVKEIEADVIVVAAYGFIIPSAILSCKKYGCLNVHPSKLPKYRGAAPIQRVIINGESETAVCVIQMDEGLDTGDIILSREFIIDDRTTAEQLYDKCAKIGAELVMEVLGDIDTLPRAKQAEGPVSYASKLTKEEGRINWSEDAKIIDNKVRGMTPWPGAFFELDGRIIKITSCEPIIAQSTGHSVGDLIGEYADVVCGRWILRVYKIKPSGKPEMVWRDFLRGLGPVKNINSLC